MNFVETVPVTGHLTIVKLNHKTGSVETILDNNNVICSGLGRSIAQFMSLSGCVAETCPKTTPSEACDLSFYKISKFQVGVGADAITSSQSLVSLGKPLTKEEYGGGLKSVSVSNAMLMRDQELQVEEQAFATIEHQGFLEPSSLVSVWVLDEETANGVTLNEAGMFVENPYLRQRRTLTDPGNSAPAINLLGGSFGGGSSDGGSSDYEYSPGHYLAAYRQFTPIKKDGYFSLLFRWEIKFSEEH